MFHTRYMPWAPFYLLILLSTKLVPLFCCFLSTSAKGKHATLTLLGSSGGTSETILKAGHSGKGTSHSARDGDPSSCEHLPHLDNLKA